VTSTRCEELPVCLIGERLVFMRSFTVVLETGGGTYQISLPEGYSWDGASTPEPEQSGWLAMPCFSNVWSGQGCRDGGGLACGVP